MLGETIKFEKSYNDGSNLVIKYHGKAIEGTKISGNWWVPGEKRLHGTFFMWNKEYEVNLDLKRFNDCVKSIRKWLP